MVNLTHYGFEPCTMSGECDFCRQFTPQPNYFWRSTSHEYTEGDYYCRTCALQDITMFEVFLTLFSVQNT